MIPYNIITDKAFLSFHFEARDSELGLFMNSYRLA